MQADFILKSWTATTGWIAIFAGHCTGGATDYGADISICSYYEVGEQGMRCGASGDGGDTVVYDRREALRLLYEDSLIRSYFWDKLFKRELFDGVLFPEDHTVFEDMAIM